MNVSIERVSFSYPAGVMALREVSIAIAPGEAVAIIGENGAGKTTLARHLNGLLRPSSGRVLIGELDTRAVSAAKLAARVGYVFQNPDDQLFARTTLEEASFGPRNLGMPAQDAIRVARRALERVGLDGEAERHPYDLHVSQRKLAALAATLAMNTPIVALDEPTTGQDAPGVERVGAIVEELKTERRTVIAITHDIDFCAEHFERVIVMAGGRVLADGPARATLAQADTLAQAEVEPPQLVRLARALGMAETPLGAEEFVEAWSLAQSRGLLRAPQEQGPETLGGTRESDAPDRLRPPRPAEPPAEDRGDGGDDQPVGGANHHADPGSG